MEEQVTQQPEACKTGLTCPACKYAGHGFRYIEFVPTVSEILGRYVRLDRAEPQYDQIDLDSDRIEFPACGHHFPVPEDFVEGGAMEFDFEFHFPTQLAA